MSSSQTGSSTKVDLLHTNELTVDTSTALRKVDMSICIRDVTRVGETIAYSRLRRDLDDFGRSRLLVLVLQQQLA